MPAARRAAILAAAVLAPAAAASAQDLFGVTVTGDDGETVTVTGSSLFDLAENVIESKGDFEQFEGRDFTGSLDYAGLDDAIVIGGNTDDTVRVRIPSIGFDRTFDDEDEAEDFLRNDGADVVADFIAVVNKRTLVGVTDGNPAALTATLADDAYRNFGQFRNPFATHVQGGDAVRLYASAGSIDTDVGGGTLYEAALGTSIPFTDRVALTFSTPFAYRKIEGSETFSLGTQIGLPIQIAPPVSDTQPIVWQIAPYALAAGGGSQDQLAGGLILGGGAVNLVGVKLGRVVLHSAQQVAGYTGTPIEVGDFRFETEVDQVLLRVGAGLTYAGIGQPYYLHAGVAYTDFLNDAAVDSYLSPVAALGVNLGGENALRLGYRGDLGDGYDAHRGEIELRFAF